MLVLSRKLGEVAVIDGRIRIQVMHMGTDTIKLGIEAPAEVPVHRLEVYREIEQNNRAAARRARAERLPKLKRNR